MTLSSAYKEKQLHSSVYLFYPCKILVLLCLQLVEELVEKWQLYPKSQQTPICAHLLGLAMKIVTQLAMGTRFAQDAEVIRFRKNHEAVSSCFKLLFLTDIVIKDNSLFFCHVDLVRDWERIPGRFYGEELQQEGAL